MDETGESPSGVNKMKRENQAFQGKLRDKELYLIEDALSGKTVDREEADKLIMKLYSEFWETK